MHFRAYPSTADGQGWLKMLKAEESEVDIELWWLFVEQFPVYPGTADG